MEKHFKSSQELIKLLVERRKELGLSQSDLAQMCNLSVNGISKFESNQDEREIKLSTLFKLAPYLGYKLKIEFES